MTDDVRDLRTQLRSTTAVAHAQLESALDLLAEPCDRSRFIALLQRFRDFHAVWEPALARALPADVALLAPRSKLALIDADLRALGAAATGLPSPRCTALAIDLCRDAPSALGSFYVLEGSTLGGKFIARHLSRAAADWLPPSGLRYFDPYGDATGARWKETLARLDAVPIADWPGVEAGAIATFRGLQAWLTEVPVARHADEVAST